MWVQPYSAMGHGLSSASAMPNYTGVLSSVQRRGSKNCILLRKRVFFFIVFLFFFGIKGKPEKHAASRYKKRLGRWVNGGDPPPF